MTGRKILCMSLCISLILMFITSIALVNIPHVGANPDTILSLNPMNITVPPQGYSLPYNFSIDVNVTDVTDMKGFEFKLWYNATLLNATILSPSAITETATKWLPVDSSMNFHWDGPPTINNTLGRIWIYGWGFTTFTGSGVLLTINFTATAVGNCTLQFEEGEHYLYDNYSDEILHSAYDGEVTVIPEFPTFIIMPLLLIATLAAIFLGKIFWSRKRKDVLIAR